MISCVLIYFSFKWVGRIESIVVLIKMSILALFVVLGFWGLHHSHYMAQLGFGHWESIPGLIASSMIIFVAYEGFELIANAAHHIRNPDKNIVRSYYWAGGFVILLYVLIAIITVGSPDFAAIDKAKDYALAAAARPFLGDAGYVVISVTTMLSVVSAINATLYGGSRVNYKLAEDGELPHEFTHYFWNQPVGPAGDHAAGRQRARPGEHFDVGRFGLPADFRAGQPGQLPPSAGERFRRFIGMLGCLLCVVSLLILLGEQYGTNLTGAAAASALIVVSYALEWAYKRSHTKSRPA